MQEKTKRSWRKSILYLILGLLFGVILVGAVSVVALITLNLPVTLENLVQLHVTFPLFLVLDFFVLYSGLIFGWVGIQEDRLDVYRRQARSVTQSHDQELQQLRASQAELDQVHQAEIAQLNGQLEEQGTRFQELEAVIRRGKQQWEGTFDAVDDLIILTDETGVILRCNRTTGEVLQTGYSQIVGRGIDELFSDGIESPQQLAPGERKEMKLPASEDWYQISKNHLLVDGMQEGWVYIFRNITPQKQALREQKRLTYYYELLVNNSPVAILTLNSEDRIIDCNPAFERMFLYNKQEGLGRKSDALISPPDLIFETRGMAETVRNGETVRKVTQRRRKDGSLVDVEVFGIPVILAGKQIGSLVLYHDVSEFVRPQKVEAEPPEKTSGEAARILMTKFVEDAYITQFEAPQTEESAPETVETELLLDEVSEQVEEDLSPELQEPVEDVVLEFQEPEEDFVPELQETGEILLPELEEPVENLAAELQEPEEAVAVSSSPLRRKRPIPIEKIEGIGPVYGRKLSELGVLTTEDLLSLGKSRKGREELVERSGISATQVLRWINMADLMRVHGIGEEYSELLEKAGVDTIKELRNRNPDHLYEAMKHANESHKMVNRLPHLSEVQSWVKEAKELEPVMTY